MLSGEIVVENDLIFERPVKIESGTTFLIGEKISVIFKNRVEALGEKDNKIIFKANSNKPWGTVALLGKNTSGSKIKNVDFYDGSGSVTNQYTFTSMFSIHNTSNIELENIDFKNNYYFDDMMHAIYSSNIRMNNLNFSNAFGDAIDIDICENIKIENSNFYNSKNDGIDLMESNVDITNVNIFNSGDKGISIGESSEAKLSRSNLEKNKVAIAVKDNSKVVINNVNFLDNKNQISAYKKNLQYGSGGNAMIFKSKFKAKENNFLSKKSIISIKNSKFSGLLNTKGDKIVIDDRK